ncbi:MAG: autotransporter outer membrane beta-barrel domain-containing protein [Alphaproteobacteria bacterium]|nr:autotransporter outer membrane beta-barrel domain-containing protein [Alphaproteobacteria bacterium]
MKAVPVIYCVCILCPFGAFAVSFNGDTFGGVVNIAQHSCVNEYVNFKPTTVNVNSSLIFVNYGVVDSKFIVCEACELQIKNYGNFVADFEVGDNASVVQMVTKDDEMNPVESDVKYTLFLDGVQGVDLGGWQDGLNKIVLKNSSIDIDGGEFNDELLVELRGVVVLNISDVSGLGDGPIVQNLSGDGWLGLNLENTDPLYLYHGYVKDDDYYIKRVRETDYVKVLQNDNLGVFLNELRETNPNDALLKQLDLATDIEAVHRIVNQSVRLNPERLLRPVRTIKAFDKIGFANKGGLEIKTDFISSDDFYSYSIRMGNVIQIGQLNVGAGLYIGNVDYKTDIDQFDGIYYGLNLFADYLMENNLFVRGMVDFARFDFDIENVFYDNKVMNSPYVLSINGDLDFGYKYKLSDSLRVMPFVGVDLRENSVLDEFNVDVRGRIGVDIGYEYQMLGMQYGYVAGVSANSENEFMAQVRAGFWSSYDNVGADVGVAMLEMFDVYSYQVFVDARLVF